MVLKTEMTHPTQGFTQADRIPTQNIILTFLLVLTTPWLHDCHRAGDIQRLAVSHGINPRESRLAQVLGTFDVLVPEKDIEGKGNEMG